MLTFYQDSAFGTLRPRDVPTDQFNYHLQALVKSALLEAYGKGRKKCYALTTSGKRFVEQLETDLSKILTQGKRSVLLCCWRKRGSKIEVLVHERTKEPFRGFVGFHSGKVRERETIFQAAARELKEETNLSGKLCLKQILHYIDYNEKNEFLRDGYLWVVECKNPKGVVCAEPKEEGVRNFWGTKGQLLKGKHKFFPGFWDDIYIWNKKATFFIEKVRVVKGF